MRSVSQGISCFLNAFSLFPEIIFFHFCFRFAFFVSFVLFLFSERHLYRTNRIMDYFQKIPVITVISFVSKNNNNNTEPVMLRMSKVLGKNTGKNYVHFKSLSS